MRPSIFNSDLERRAKALMIEPETSWDQVVNIIVVLKCYIDELQARIEELEMSDDARCPLTPEHRALVFRAARLD